jgi:quercetin dioxygenase-like cupin family protein
MLSRSWGPAPFAPTRARMTYENGVSGALDKVQSGVISSKMESSARIGGEMNIVSVAEREAVEIEGNRMKGIAVAATGATEAEVWEAVMVPGASTPPHSHDAEEIVLVVEGGITADVDGETVEVGAGEVVVVPAGRIHQLHNRAAGETRKFAVLGRVGAKTFWPDGSVLETPWQD